MSFVSDQSLINKLSTHFAAISGITYAATYANNPDSLPNARLPCVMFLPMAFEATQKAHPKTYSSVVDIRAILFVKSMESSGAKLKFIENDAIPFGALIRNKFADKTVVSDFLSLGLTRAYEFAGEYGAGGPYLTFNGVAYIGWVVSFKFKDIDSC